MNSPTDLQMRTVVDEVDPSDGDHAQDIDGGPGVATWQPDEWDEEDVDSTDSDEDDVEMSTPGAVNPEEAQLVSFTSVSPDLAEHPLQRRLQDGQRRLHCHCHSSSYEFSL